MQMHLLPLLTLVAASTLFGCSTAPADSDSPDTNDTDETIDSGDTGDSASDVSGDLVLDDSNNYSFSGTLNIPSTPVQSQTDLTVDWSALAYDFQCHEVDPANDIDNVAVLVFQDLSEEEVEDGLVNDTLSQLDLSAYISLEMDAATSTQLSLLTFFGTDPEILEHFTEGSGTWLWMFTTGTEVTQGARMFHFMEPLDSETNNSVTIESGCDVLDAQVDLKTLNPAQIATTGPWTVDWSNLTLDGRGSELTLSQIDGVMLGHYTDKTIEELEGQVLDLEYIADTLWTSDVKSGTTIALTDLESETGNFSELSADGVWILALTCSSCSNPAPLFLTLLEPK